MLVVAVFVANIVRDPVQGCSSIVVPLVVP
jgi:hypothetical protein